MRRLVIVAVVLAALAGCGDDAVSSVGTQKNQPTAGRLDEAAAWLRRLIDATAEQTAPGVRTQVSDDGTGRKLCDQGGRTQDEDYSIFIDVPADQMEAALDRARRYWQSLGYRVQPDESTVRPAIDIFPDDLGGYSAGIELRKDEGTVHLSGSTPCFPVSEDDG